MERSMIAFCSVMYKAEVTMRLVEYCLILCSLFMNGHGLYCRSEVGPKEGELKKIYNTCLKQQIRSNNSNNNGGDLDQSRRESRRHNEWSQENVSRNRGGDTSDYGMGQRGRGVRDRMDNRNKGEEQNRMRQQDRGNKNRDYTMQNRDRDGDDMYSDDGRGERQNNNGDNKSQRNNGVSNRNDFFQNENYDGYNNNQYSTQPTRRYKRERRIEVNSGKRSQYNPNLQRFSGREDSYKDEDNNSRDSNSTNDDDNQACAIHCLLENLEMTGENGMADRYLVTHTMTKGIRDEDLKDFLQESIEECFQILNNENIDDKCEFSKNLMMCLSEKGRANCDDWQDNFEF